MKNHLQPVPMITGGDVKISPFNKPINTSRLETESIRREDVDSSLLHNKEFNLHDSELESAGHHAAALLYSSGNE